MDNKIINYRREENYRGLVEEIAVGIVEYRKREAMTRIEWKYWLARTISENPVYQKFGKGNQEFILNLSKDVNRELKKEEARLGKSVVYDLLAVYEKYPDSEKAVVEITKQGLSPYNWGSFLTLIGRVHSTETETTCRHCLLHCPKNE